MVINLLIQKQLPIYCHFLFKAPSVVPKLNIKHNWTPDTEIYWDEIPLEKRNGLIKSYKVFYWDKKGHVKGRLKA